MTNNGEIRRVAFELARLSEQLADAANAAARETRGEIAAVAARLATLAEELAVGASDDHAAHDPAQPVG